MENKKQNIPNLFIVGAPKCGTSSLHYYLSQHPDIYMSEEKELYYFSDDFNKNIQFEKIKGLYPYRETKEFLSIFEKRSEKYLGESTPIYLYSKNAANNIFNFNKDSKIIIMLREPIDFLQSLHSEYLFNLFEKEKNFLKALNLENKRKNGKKVPKSAFCVDYLYYSEIVKFTNQIKRYLNVFPKENINVILFDNFKTNTKGIVDNIIHNFLNLDKSYNINYEVINKAKYRNLDFIRKFASSKYVFPVFKFLLPIKFYNYIRDNIIYKITIIKKKRKNKVTNKDILVLKKQYKQEVIDLNNLLHENNLIDKNTDLIKLWGYDNI